MSSQLLSPSSSAELANLASAVRAMVSPESSASTRQAAFQLVENFKTQAAPMHVVRTALAIIDGFTDDLVLRHVGLKLLEDAIRLRWNELEGPDKLSVKEAVMSSLLRSNMLEQTSSAKDGVARLVVEMAKREWPQQWPDFLKELHQATLNGPLQTEVVMLVLLRLVEDVVVLQTLQQPQRRKEIAQALTQNMPEIFAFLLGLLEKYYETKSVCKGILNTFGIFVEWIPITTTLANDGYLVKCLCVLLSDAELQLEAAECLLGIVGWKAGKIGDRAHVLVLFKTEMMAPIFQAVERAHAQSMSNFNPSHYHFLKKLVQILGELGNQLTTIWIKDKKPAMKCPDNFEIYLRALVALAEHPSHSLNIFVLEAFNRFLRHPMISKEEVFQQNLRQYTTIIIKNCLKKGLPSKRDDPSCLFSSIDFTTDEEFNAFFGKYRIIALEGIKVIASNISAQLPFQEVHTWLKQVFSNITTSSTALSTNAVDQLTKELDALASVLDAIFSAPLTSLSAILSDSISLLGVCLETEVNNANIASAMLSVISSLFVVVTINPDSLLVPTLTRIFAPLNNQGGAIDKNPLTNAAASLAPKFSPEVKALRQHCCSLLVKIASKHPVTLLHRFQDLNNIIMQLYKSEAVTLHEYATLVESLILVSNEQQSYEFQSNLIQAVSEHVILVRVIKNQEVIHAMSDVGAFVHFLQLEGFSSTMQQQTLSAEDEVKVREQRSQMSFWLHFILALCRRSQTPTSIDVCRKGNFVLQEFQIDNKQYVALKNPVFPVTQAVLSQLMTLIVTLNQLYQPEQKVVHPDLLAPLVAEKNTLLGISRHNAPVVVSNATQVNSNDNGVDNPNDDNDGSSETGQKSKRELEAYYLFNVFENSYNLFTQICLTGGHEAFANLTAPDVQASLLSGLNWLPHIRLRAVVKAIKAVINKCPRLYFESLILPLLMHLTNVMLARLSDHWAKNYNSNVLGNVIEDNEENDDSQEVLDDVVGRQLTREYLDVLKAALSSGGGADIDLSSENGLKSEESSQSDGSKASNSSTNSALSDLGQRVIQTQPMSDCILTTLLKALRWPDSPSSVRAANLIETLLPHLSSIKSSQIGPETLMIEVLKSLNELGHHEPNYIALLPLAIHVYERLRPVSEGVKHVLAQVPGCVSEDLERFDERIVNKCVQEKAKKDMFRKMVQSFIGKDVGKMFQHEVVIKNLPAPVKKAKPNTNVLMEKNNDEEGVVGQLFQQ